MTNIMETKRQRFYPQEIDYDADLEPYMALFQKPLTTKKSGFSKQDLAVMCKDPLHSPSLILYLIDFVKKM